MSTRTLWTYNTKPEKQCTGQSARPVCPHRHRRYGMSCADWAALLRRANGRCEICHVTGAETSHGYLVIDHDYRAGAHAVRGLLCSTCNTQIAYACNDINAEAKRCYLANPWFLSNRETLAAKPEKPQEG